MGTLKTRELPKYTQYEITALVNKMINAQTQDLFELSSSFEIDSEILSEILAGDVVFKMPHYKTASIILKIDVEELLSELEYDAEFYFRSDTNNSEINEFVNKMEYLFTEWVYQKKIAGNIE
ncbi:hypothetical protein R6Z02_12845 [Carnobacterium maltaromaticum]|uniref:hypothetical protein n=1 Tax=Carnobacterium maltaromaticum TaxID=2751 RepID=UPI00298BBB98|nr:hypothetical protein [Carnobacterium maltaromaticum]MDW5524639.1 hypothetical protein [Carnobacterium maltaromaticum]